MDERIIWQDAIYEDEREWDEAYRDETGEECQNLDEFIADRVSENFEDERENLDVAIPSGIVLIADLGLWDGRRTAFPKGDLKNLRECLESHCNGYLKVFVENGELKAEESHHDGTNVYTFRKWREGVSESEKEDAKWDYFGIGPDALMSKTESLAPDVARIYGW